MIKSRFPSRSGLNVRMRTGLLMALMLCLLGNSILSVACETADSAHFISEPQQDATLDSPSEPPSPEACCDFCLNTSHAGQGCTHGVAGLANKIILMPPSMWITRLSVLATLPIPTLSSPDLFRPPIFS